MASARLMDNPSSQRKINTAALEKFQGHSQRRRNKTKWSETDRLYGILVFVLSSPNKSSLHHPARRGAALATRTFCARDLRQTNRLMTAARRRESPKKAGKMNDRAPDTVAAASVSFNNRLKGNS